MANLQDLIKKYISEVENTTDKNQAARSVASKLKGLQYTERNTNIPKADLVSTLRVIKGSANDSHIELIDAIVAILEKDSAE